MKYPLAFTALFLVWACSRTPERKQVLTQALYESLAWSNKLKASENQRMLTTLKHAVHSFESNGGKVKGRMVEDCDTILAQTDAVLACLRNTRLHLRRYATQAVRHDAAELMLADDKQGLAYDVLKKVDAYSAALCKIEPTWKPLLLLSLQGSSSNKDAIQIYFADASIPEAFAALSHIEAEILDFERELIWHLQIRFTDEDNVIWSRIVAFAGAESNIITEGDTYKAEMQLFATFPQVPLTMKLFRK